MVAAWRGFRSKTPLNSSPADEEMKRRVCVLDREQTRVLVHLELFHLRLICDVKSVEAPQVPFVWTWRINSAITKLQRRRVLTEKRSESWGIYVVPVIRWNICVYACWRRVFSLFFWFFWRLGTLYRSNFLLLFIFIDILLLLSSSLFSQCCSVDTAVVGYFVLMSNLKLLRF